jgi:pyruvate,water dikinase
VARQAGLLQDLSPAELARRCSSLQRLILESDIPTSLATEILEAHARLMTGSASNATCAVRSSATAEDLAGASFAGQHGTYYYVDGARLLEMVRHCWASLWSPEAASYRSTHGIPHGSVRMAVVVQQMVRSEVSGVAFTANPVTGDRGAVVIESSFGMGAAIVDGRVTPDRYVVARDHALSLRERRIAQKRFMVESHLADAGGQRLVAVSHERQRAESLTAEDAREVARWALRCEELFKAPQDIEWAMAGGRFHLLQSRPITTLSRPQGEAPVRGKWVLFKAVAENFTDPITPLTADLLSVLFMPGLRFFGGRLYVNIRGIAPFVPFTISDEDLARALYLSGRGDAPPLRLSLRKLPLALLGGLVSYLIAGVLLARTRGMPDGFMESYRRLCQEVGDDPSLDAVQALQRLTILPSPLDPLGHMAIFVNLTSLRFAPWMAALSHMLRRWAPGLRADAVAVLCSGSEGVLSAEMGRGIWDLAGEARREPAVREILLAHPPEEALALLRADPAARAFVLRLDAFLAVHGHRAIKEFEMRTARWQEDPTPVLGMVRNYLLIAEADPQERGRQALRERTELEAEVRRALGSGPLGLLRARLVALAARRARYYLKLRENSRFYHIMSLGMLRKRIVALEADLRRDGRLKCRDDIFFLKWNEVVALREGRLDWPRVEERIRQRRLEHVRLSKIDPPRTFGIERREAAPAPTVAGVLEGQPASPGRYTGLARVILDPSVDLTLRPGEVLVAPYTDPAWTPLFLMAGAAVVEVGSYLSHAGTVAREYGLPCVVDAAGCTRRIATGTRVEVDGSTGVVRILDEAEATA